MNLPEGLIALLRQPSLCFLATVMPDGSPQVTQTWVDTDGEHVVINSVRDHQKVKNVARDPRVAVNVCDVARPPTRGTGGRDQVRVILTIEAARIRP
jgi:PPOX class probable F420-dependent enzyme